VRAEVVTQISVSQVLTKGARPIGGLLKDFEWTPPAACSAVCRNFW
jgi:hypothetical protein